jgi:hypothetical protein
VHLEHLERETLVILLRAATVFAWMIARLLIITVYTGAFGLLSSLGLQSLGCNNELVTVYMPAVLAVILCVGGFHSLFGPELRREMAKDRAPSLLRRA